MYVDVGRYVCMYVCNLIWLMEVAGLFATEIMSLPNNKIASLSLLFTGESNDDLQQLLARPGYKPKKWMKKDYLRDCMTIEEHWSNGWRHVSEWRIVGAYVM